MQPEERWIPWATLLMGAAFLVLGVRVRLGLHRNFRWQYFSPDLPAFQRNASVALIPGGLAFILGSVAVLVAAGATAESEPARAVATLILGLLSLVSGGVAFWVMFRPPQWSKPDWLREEERARREGRPVEEVPAVALTPGQYRVGWVVWGLALLGWWVLDRSGGLLIGLGLAANILFAARPRRAPAGPPGRAEGGDCG